tara:strand:+ start:127 stop:642 length:516 start_codon:yes stop_codon:yes gene_type:complete
MVISIDMSRVLHTSVAAVLVISGVVMKNSFEQLKMPNHAIGKPLGMLLFTLGWIYTAKVLSDDRQSKMWFIVPSLTILVSVMVMKHYMQKGNNPPMILPLLFAISWILLGAKVGEHRIDYLKYTGLAASILVLLSMMVSLPWQRSVCVVDGPGMPLFVAAWGIIILLNSSR